MNVRTLVCMSIMNLIIACLPVSAAASAAAPPGWADPVRAGVDQVAPGVLQFWMELAGPPYLESEPEHWATYTWCVDTDCDPATGQRHGAVGSEYNIRAVLRNDAAHGGGFVDGIDGRRGCIVPMFLDDNRVLVRVSLEQVGNPVRFKWNYGAFASNGVQKHLDSATEFQRSPATARGDQPARVVVQPYVMLRNGVTSATPEVRAFDAKGASLSLEGRRVSLFCYSDVARVKSRQIQALPRRAGLVKLTALVDGVLSCNVGRAMVGTIEVVPSCLHLQFPSRPAGRVALRVSDASNEAIPTQGDRVRLTNDNSNVATLSSDGSVTALAAGAGKSTGIRGEFDGTPASNHCSVRVLRYAVPLLAEREEVGRYVTFWYPPVATRPGPPGCRFEQILEQFDYVHTLDEIYLRMWELTGVAPQGAWRLAVIALCEDDVFKLCGAAGQNVGLGFNPLKPSSCVQLDQGPPHWGVVSHEMGHLFVGEFSALNRILGDSRLPSGPAYGEGLATLCNMWARHAIVGRGDDYGVAAGVVRSFTDPEIYDSLPFHRRIFVQERLAEYLRNGTRYPGDLTADVLDGIFIVLSEQYGTHIFPRFFSVFWPPDEPLDFAPRNEIERATFFTAAMSVAARGDLRRRFASWGFPCDEVLFQKLLPELTWRAAQRD